MSLRFSSSLRSPVKMVSTRSAANKRTTAVSKPSLKSNSARRRTKTSPKRVVRKTQSATPVTIEGDVDAGHISAQGTLTATSTTSVTNCENCDTSVIEEVEDLRITASAKLRPDPKKTRSTHEKVVHHSGSKRKSGQRGKNGRRSSTSKSRSSRPRKRAVPRKNPASKSRLDSDAPTSTADESDASEMSGSVTRCHAQRPSEERNSKRVLRSRKTHRSSHPATGTRHSSRENRRTSTSRRSTGRTASRR